MTGTMTIQQAEDSLLVPLYNKREIALARGEGVHVWDSDGKQYLDLTSNYGVNVLGHCHPALTEAIVRQAQTLTNCHAAFYSEPRARLLEALRRVYPAELARFFFCNSGAEAVEAALKFARAVRPDRRAVVAAKKAYHGRTMGALPATHDKKYREAYEPLLPGFSHVAYGDVAELEAAVDDGTMAVILEPVQGEGGVNLPPDGYLAAARAICDRAGALLIFDEVQTAFRTGRWLACQHSRRHPRPGGGLEGHRRWAADGAGGDDRGGRGGGPGRHPRQHLRRQPAGLRRRAGGDRDDRARGAAGAQRRGRRLLPGAPGRRRRPAACATCAASA